ncbi:MAG: Crp/Fnr family transcriptional regulator [Variovorax sp.]|nr:MAG: Crp/Fnr family transcriptional regulator [Variovorax sp.]
MLEGAVGANSLLTALMRGAPGPWQNQLEVVRLSLGEVLHEPYLVRDFVYFPLTAVVALLHVLEDGSTAEIAVVGSEGVVNLSLFMGDDITPGSAMVQCAGFAIRLRADLLEEVFVSDAQAGRLLMRYSQTLIAQMAQTASCNRHHPVHQRLCRWLLLMLDRRVGNGMPMTPELIATMLGVRRASVSGASAALQNEGLIMGGRGRITVLNRPAMERRVCECYAVIKSEHDRLLPALNALLEEAPEASDPAAQKKAP